MSLSETETARAEGQSWRFTDFIPLPDAIMSLIESLIMGYTIFAVCESAFNWSVLPGKVLAIGGST